jgi:predicted Zn-dependent protease
MLRIQPKFRSNWIGLAVAYHLAGELEKAHDVLVKYEGMLEEITKGDYELGEVILYHAEILEEIGKLEEARAYLEESRDRVVDIRGLQEIKARILLKLGRKDEAAAIRLEQLDDNSESHSNIRGYLEAKGHKNRKALSQLPLLVSNIKSYSHRAGGPRSCSCHS